MSELDAIGVLAGTDKSSSVSWSWDYLRHYEQLFSRWRHSEINLIEIGIASGASIATWLKYFDRAQIVGVEINPDGRRYAGERVAIRIGSQEDPGFLHSVVAEFPPTIIIDDGSHLAHHMIASFEALFPALQPGGVYIFEDMAFHFDESARRFQDARAHQGLAPEPIYDYLSKFIRARAASVTIPEASWGFSRYAFEQIDSITVGGGFIAVIKRASADLHETIATFERELSVPSADRHGMALRYAEFLVKHDHRLDRAVPLLQSVVAAEPGNQPALNLLVELLIRAEQFDDASIVADRLTGLDHLNISHWDRLAGLERRLNRPDRERSALRHLVALQPKRPGYHYRLSELEQHFGDPHTALSEARIARELEPSNIIFANHVAGLEDQVGVS